MARELYFVLTPGFMLLDFAGPAEAFRIANQFGAALHLHYCAPHEATPSSLGLPLGGLAPLPDTLPDGAVILIPGAAGSADAYAQPEARTVIAWLRRVFDPARHILATVCSAALLAAEAGSTNTPSALATRCRTIACMCRTARCGAAPASPQA